MKRVLNEVFRHVVTKAGVKGEAEEEERGVGRDQETELFQSVDG